MIALCRSSIDVTVTFPAPCLPRADGVLALPAAPGPAPLLRTPPAELDAFRQRLLELTCLAVRAGQRTREQLRHLYARLAFGGWRIRAMLTLSRLAAAGPLWLPAAVRAARPASRGARWARAHR